MHTEKKGNIQLTVPFGINDMDASLRFYVDGLGFSMQKNWTPRGKIEWCWLVRDAVALMLQEPNSSGPIIGSRKIVKGQACPLTMEEPFVGNNRWVVSVKDPDGYFLQFQSMTSVPEETMYSAWFT